LICVFILVFLFQLFAKSWAKTFQVLFAPHINFCTKAVFMGWFLKNVHVMVVI